MTEQRIDEFFLMHSARAFANVVLTMLGPIFVGITFTG